MTTHRQRLGAHTPLHPEARATSRRVSGSPKAGFARHPAARGDLGRPSRPGDELVLARVYRAHDGTPDLYDVEADRQAERDFADPWTKTDVLLVLVFGALVALGIFAGFSGWGVG